MGQEDRTELGSSYGSAYRLKFGLDKGTGMVYYVGSSEVSKCWGSSKIEYILFILRYLTQLIITSTWRKAAASGGRRWLYLKEKTLIPEIYQ